METYLEMVKSDIKKYFMSDVRETLADCNNDKEQALEILNDLFWDSDSITGNRSGSYIFNIEEAKLVVFDHMPEIVDFYISTGDLDLLANDLKNERWESLDVTGRCSVLDRAIKEILGELV